MSCHDSKDNFVTIKANSVNGVSEYRYSIKPIDNSSAPLNKNGANATFTGADGLQGNDNPPLYLQYLVVAENIIYNSQVGGGTKTMYTCPSKIDTFSMRNPSQLQILNLDVIEYNNNAQIQCNGYNNGRVDVIARGGTLPYLYSYDNFSNSKPEIRFNNLKPDTTYTFSVKDNNGCETSRTTILTEPEPLKATRIPNVYSDYFNIRCKDGSDGVITFDNVTGGTGPYRYSITGDAPYYSNNTFTGLIKGFYNLTVVDTNDCIYNDTLTLIEPTQLVLDSILTKQPDCFGYNDGMIQMVADGGVTHLPYTFSIDNYSNPYTKIPVNPAYYNDSATFTGLTTFNYNFTVEDANGCSANKFIFLNQPKDIQITFDASNVICSGDANGELYAFVSGGTKPYYYTWTGGSLDVEKSPSDSIVKNLNSDSYKLILTDAKGCNSVKMANILEPMPLWANVNKIVQATCYDAHDASIEIVSGGGYTPHYYSINGSPFIAHRNFFDTLSAGSYIIKVRDAAGCEITLPAVEIAKPNALSAQAIVKDVTCSYKSDGMVTLTASGGNGNYQYAYGWDGSFSNFKTFYNLKPGWHLIRIKDEKNCVLDKDIFVGSPDELELTQINTTNSTCGESNGSAIVQALGGTAPYKYTWMNQNAEGNSIVNLPMGVHPIVVTDAKRCKDTLEVGISDESGPVVNIASLTIPSCFDSDNGSVTVEVQGGNAGHTFQWYDENRQTGTTASNLKDGMYLVKVTNASNCGTVKTIVIDAPEEQKIIVDQVTPSLCYGACNGEIGVYATGGTEPYSYIWDAPGQPTGALINNLCEGKYTVTLTDANGCIATQLIDLVNPAQMQIAIEDNMNLCTDQSIMLDAGNEGSTYTWLSFNGFKSNEQRVTISAPGNYNLTIVNENGCKLSKDFTVQVIEDLLDANFLVQGSSIVGDTIVFVEVSLPRPDRIEWKFTDNVTVKRLIGPYAFVNYPSPGTYLVNLTAYLGSCVDVVQKEVTIYNPEDYPGRVSSDKSRQGILMVKVFPVPNHGEFTAQVTLGIAEPITISLYDILGNAVSKSYKTNSSFYTENFKLPFNAIQEGIYILRVETATDVRVEKVMIVK